MNKQAGAELSVPADFEIGNPLSAVFLSPPKRIGPMPLELTNSRRVRLEEVSEIFGSRPISDFCSVCAAVGFAESWADYKDGTQKCKLKYASSIFARGAIDSENFQRFSGPNKDTYFRVLGHPNEEQLTPGEIRAEYIKKKGTTDLVYERTTRDFLVLSGYRGKNIFYTKIALSPDNETICVLHLSYPRRAKRAFDAIVTRMSQSFAAEN